MTFFAFGLCVVRVRTALYALVSRDVGCPIFFRNRRHSAKDVVTALLPQYVKEITAVFVELPYNC